MPGPTETRRSSPSGAGSFWVSLRAAAVMAALVHVAFLALFLALGVIPLAALNVASIATFAGCWWLLGQRRNTLAYLLIFGEICVHAGAAVLVIGRESGFQYYLLATIAPLAIAGVMTPRARLSSIAGVGVYFEFLDMMAQGSPPWVVLEVPVLMGLRWLNLGATIGLMAFVAWLYAGLIRKSEAALQLLATTDPLTGLNNRRRLIDIASGERTGPAGGSGSLCVLLCDIDHFKAVNDGHGHDTGDRALRFVAELMEGMTRPGDSVARWGGEEFLMLMCDMDLGTAARAAERLRQSVATTPFPLSDGRQLSITITVGVAMLRQGEIIDAAIARADAALYRGKSEGRDCVREEFEPAGGAHPAPQAQPQSRSGSLAA